MMFLTEHKDVFNLSINLSCPNSLLPLFFLSGIYNPYEFELPHSGGSEITRKDTTQSVGLLWTSDQLVAETST